MPRKGEFERIWKQVDKDLRKSLLVNKELIPLEVGVNFNKFCQFFLFHLHINQVKARVDYWLHSNITLALVELTGPDLEVVQGVVN